MKKSKFYVLFSLLIVILLFSVSALCNQCGIITPTTAAAAATETSTEKTDTGESKESALEETTAESTGNTKETTDKT